MGGSQLKKRLLSFGSQLFFYIRRKSTLNVENLRSHSGKLIAIGERVGSEDGSNQHVRGLRRCVLTRVFPKNNNGTPKSSILIGFSIIFTIHFGGPPLFLERSTRFFVVCHGLPEIQNTLRQHKSA